MMVWSSPVVILADWASPWSIALMTWPVSTVL